MSADGNNGAPARVEKLRVVELSGAFGIGGTEQAVEIRAGLLDRACFDVRAVGVFGGARLTRLRARGVEVRDLAGDLAQLAPLLEEFSPHVLHYTRSERDCEHSKAVQEQALRARIPVLIETNVFGRPAGWEQRRAPDHTCHMSLASMLRCARLAGRSMSELYAEGHRAVYLPVPTPEGYGTVPPERDAARDALGVRPGELLACRVARPDLRKWSLRLELALPRLFEEIPELRFAFMAAPPEKARRLVARFGRRVICLEPDSSFERVGGLYKASDLMLHASGIGESFGLAVAEAMFHGLPVVVDSTPELDNAQVEVVEHERTGLVVRSSAGFVAAARRLARNPDERAAFGRAGHERAATWFADRVVRGTWQSLYAEASARAGVELSASLSALLENGRHAVSPEDYAAYEARYGYACRRTLGPDPDWRELGVGRMVRAWDTALYARQRGMGPILHVIKSRLRAGRLFSRD
ncbi:MAG TPA: glycosyltransferase family 4 protein [Polyangiaceae bacterium]|nr:glycosyltransferase family 4 protein [Polyangiaceae bacterium]